MPASSDDSGSRHDDPAIGACDAQRQEVAYALSEWKRADGNADAEALQCSTWAPVMVAVWMQVQMLASSEKRDVSAHAAKTIRRQVCLQKREPMKLLTSQAQDIVRVVG